MAFRDHFDRSGREVSSDSLTDAVEISIWIHGVNWMNLVDWCRKFHKGTWGTLDLDRADDVDLKVICAAHHIAGNSQGSWKSCQKQLEGLRVVAEELNPKWAQ